MDIEVSQAYEILSDVDKRKLYDQYGLDFILRGGPAPPEPGEGGMPGGGFGGFPGGFGGMPSGGRMPGGQTFSFSTGPGGGGGGFSFSNPEDIFSSFFGGGGTGGTGGGLGDDPDVFSSFGGMPGGFGGMSGHPGMRGAQSRGGMSRSRTPETTIVEKPLPVTLEEMFSGAKKRMKINRKTFDPRTGKQASEEKILEVPIKQGIKAGSKITFKDCGDQIEGGTQDIQFVLQEKEHPLYRRDGDDLRHDVEISLKEALTGWQRTVKTIDGKQVNVSGSGPTGPTYTDRFPNLGMPKSKKPTERGDFIVGVKITFPTKLTPDQKAKLKEIL